MFLRAVYPNCPWNAAESESSTQMLRITIQYSAKEYLSFVNCDTTGSNQILVSIWCCPAPKGSHTQTWMPCQCALLQGTPVRTLLQLLLPGSAGQHHLMTFKMLAPKSHELLWIPRWWHPEKWGHQGHPAAPLLVCHDDPRHHAHLGNLCTRESNQERMSL